MSGHSKFANIKHKKEKNDAAKGKIFTIIGREIAIAVKEGGADPANNSKLRDVIAKAKANNMPNDTIERGIKKAAGDGDSVNYVQVTYEGYGPSGTAIIVDALTDNKNRTAANVRSAFTKGNGNIGTPGCVSFMFDKKGQIIKREETFPLPKDPLPTQVSKQVDVYEYDTYGYLTKITFEKTLVNSDKTSGSLIFLYDEFGNQIDSNAYYEYDSTGRWIQKTDRGDAKNTEKIQIIYQQ